MAARRKPKNSPKKRRAKPAEKTEGGSATKLNLPVQAQQEQLLGRYCNVALINHTRHEFTFDFLLTVGNSSSLASRVITSPDHAKRLYEALGKNIDNYEEKFGKIVLKPDSTP